LAEAVLERVDWGFLVFEQDGKSLFHMSYNPDRGGSYVTDKPGFISQWNNASEQRMMYLQAAKSLGPMQARKLYAGFSRNTGQYQGAQFIINPLGSLYAYLCTEAWLDSRRYLDPDGVDWFENLRLAALANRQFCLEHSETIVLTMLIAGVSVAGIAHMGMRYLAVNLASASLTTMARFPSGALLLACPFSLQKLQH